MRWLIWNVRGINKWHKRKELKNYLKNKNISLAGIIEIRVKEHNARSASHHIAPRWEIFNDYNAAINGRIWLLWDTNYYSVRVIKAEAQVLHCTVTNIRNDHEYAVSIVYGFNTVEQRKLLWDNLKEIEQMTSIQWVIGGDFNAVLQLQGRMYGNPVTKAETQDFSKCIQDLKLSELAWEGDYYTWSNKQGGGDRIWSRIDRMFGNYEWMMQWGHISTVYELPFISDHAPMILTFNDQHRSRKIPFKFFNIWVDHERFNYEVQQIWKQSFHRQKMQNVWKKLKALRPVLRKLNVEEFKFIRQKIEIARIELEQVQKSIDTSSSSELLLQEKELIQNLEKWDLIEDGALKQKARAK
ncbi:PREDICTED: uncharacterized protein LOC109237736 [Nicotiana attenuata]|uniref:uncharacterized protein LOC109222285 n=1 Tax=Nicotiana attenuata TaxID=49451 RepID=UPI000904E7BC|nr:PREDICTED: uncharacterized protein LOC109222285 [Nicotiana attenuata]XP_019259637.1 PREDICTED: uncharacterized protein LOC109237736 [Nicotiana attenuata]